MTRQGYLIGPQIAVEITTDEYGDVTLRQNDATITVNANNLNTLIEILIAIGRDNYFADNDPIDDDDSSSIESLLNSPPTAPKHPPMSNAERQRRYREQHRNDKRNAKSNGVTKDASGLFDDDNGADK